MYENSRIISFAISFADGLEKAYRNSFFCKWGRNFGKTLGNMWRESILGQIIDSAFDIDTQRNSQAYRLFTRPSAALLGILSDKLYLEQGITESKYIGLIKKLNFLNRNGKQDESIIKAMFSDSFFVRTLYEFWTGMD